MRRAKLTEQEEKLLQEQMAGVEPMEKSGTLPPLGHRPATTHTTKKSVSDAPNYQNHVALPDSALGESIHWLKPGQQKKLLRRLKSPGFKAEEHLDLHGLRMAEARRLLASFLDSCRAHQSASALIIHGKGLSSSENQPVLKNLCAEILLQTPEVLGFHSAGYKDGGTGALRVLFKQHHN